jgi:outer membrane receptor protein involved in Fe transport
VDDRSSYDFVGLKQDWAYLASNRLLIRWGFDFKKGKASYDYHRWLTTAFPNLTDPAGPNFWFVTDTASIVRRPGGHEIGLYLSNRVRLAEPLTAELGVRYDHFSHTDDHTLGPRLNVAFQATPTTTLRGAWGMYHQSHGLQELFVADSDPRFYPAQRAEHRILGIEQALPHGIHLRIEAYERRTPDPRVEYRTPIPELEQVPEESMDERLRLEPDRSSARGIELLLRRDAGQRVAWNVSYALAVAEDEIDGEWIPRPFDQRHTFRGELLFRPTPQWSLSWAFQYHSGWPMTVYNYNTFTLATGGTAIGREYGPLNSERLPDYVRMDARVARHFNLGRGRLSVFLDIFNAFDRNNAESLDYEAYFANGRLMVDETYSPMLPMLPTFGMRWEF